MYYSPSNCGSPSSLMYLRGCGGWMWWKGEMAVVVDGAMRMYVDVKVSYLWMTKWLFNKSINIYSPCCFCTMLSKVLLGGVYNCFGVLQFLKVVWWPRRAAIMVDRCDGFFCVVWVREEIGVLPSLPTNGLSVFYSKSFFVFMLGCCMTQLPAVAAPLENN